MQRVWQFFHPKRIVEIAHGRVKIAIFICLDLIDNSLSFIHSLYTRESDLTNVPNVQKRLRKVNHLCFTCDAVSSTFSPYLFHPSLTEHSISICRHWGKAISLWALRRSIQTERWPEASHSRQAYWTKGWERNIHMRCLQQNLAIKVLVESASQQAQWTRSFGRTKEENNKKVVEMISRNSMSSGFTRIYVFL